MASSKSYSRSRSVVQAATPPAQVVVDAGEPSLASQAAQPETRASHARQASHARRAKDARDAPGVAAGRPELAPVLTASVAGVSQEEAADEDDDEAAIAEWLALAGPAAIPEPAPACVRVQMAAPQHGQRLDLALAQLLGERSRSQIKTLIEEGLVSCDQRPLTQASRKVVLGQWIEVILRPSAQAMAFAPEPMDLAIVHEDADILVVNKPAGLVVHPAAGNWSGTLMNGVLAHHAGAASLPRAGIVHRLDKDTSGLMVVAKSMPACQRLSQAIAQRVVKRQYLALVHGQVQAAWRIEAPVGRDPVSRVRMAVVAGGKAAMTDVERLLVAVLPTGQGSSAGVRRISAVRCTLHTGRTHQIRVHLSHAKHPLVADALYGGAAALGLTRQALHAQRLAFAHPVTGEPLSFEAALPDDLARAYECLAGAQSGV